MNVFLVEKTGGHWAQSPEGWAGSEEESVISSRPDGKYSTARSTSPEQRCPVQNKLHVKNPFSGLIILDLNASF